MEKRNCNLKPHLFRLRAILFAMRAAAELAGNRGKTVVINGRGKAGHDLVVEAKEEEMNTAEETTHSVYELFIAL